MGAPERLSAIFTTSIARTTPAQNPRGVNRIIFLLGVSVMLGRNLHYSRTRAFSIWMTKRQPGRADLPPAHGKNRFPSSETQKMPAGYPKGSGRAGRDMPKS